MKNYLETTEIEMETKKGTLRFYEHTDYIEVYLYNKKLGEIYKQGYDEEWKLICEGENPIENDWEDGLGNSLSYEGWGEFQDEK